MLEAGLIAARFLHYVSVLSLFGLALFPIYAFPNRAGLPPPRLCAWLHRIIVVALLSGLLSAAAWALFTIANMTGNLSGVADWDAFRSVLLETGFGRVWTVRLALFAALLLVSRTRLLKQQHWMPLAISTVLLASLAGVGHTQVEQGAGRFAHTAADAAHLLAAGAWLGGLLALGYLLATERQSSSPEHSAEASVALSRFSGLGALAVAVLIASGLLNTWFVLGSWAALASTAYGGLLLVKIGLFAAMLALAAMNRFVLVPRLVKERPTRQGANALAKLRHHVQAEQALGMLVVLAVSALGTMSPADA